MTGMGNILYKELQRKAVHVSGSLIPIAYYFLSKETALSGLFIINTALYAIEWLRLRGKISFPERLLRPHEKHQMGAYIYFQTAAFLSILLFDKTIAIASILMLAFGDAASGLTGSMIKGGDVRHMRERTHKPFSIMAVMFLVCLMIGIILLNIPLASDMTHVPFSVYAAGALGATIGDSIPIRIKNMAIDDNLMIPMLSGAFMTIAVILL